jgi:acylphosphatase
MSLIVAKHVWITGQVQGVFFRASAEEQGQALRLQGWVRNLPDGRVEALVQGDTDAVATFLAWCRRGPPMARVDHVEVVAELVKPTLSMFGVHF